MPTLVKFIKADDLSLICAPAQASLRWSSPRRFNDPFDCGINLNWRINLPGERERLAETLFGLASSLKIEPGKVELIDTLRSVIARHPLGVERAQTMCRQIATELITFPAKSHLAIAEHLRLLCLSGPATLTKALMWSHYAEMHRGIALELDAEVLSEAWRPQNRHLHRVSYSTHFPDLGDPVERILATLLGLPIDQSLEAAQRALTTKSVEWAYEEEWRFIHLPEWVTEQFDLSAYAPRPAADLFDDVPLPANAIRRFVLGAKCTATKECVLETARVAGITDALVARAHQSNTSFELVISPL